jgi:hypothetical protein
MSFPRTFVRFIVVTSALFAPAALFGSVVTVLPGDPHWFPFESPDSTVAITGAMPWDGNGSLEFLGATTGYSNDVGNLSYLGETWGNVEAVSIDWYVDPVSGYPLPPNPAFQLQWGDGYFCYVSWKLGASSGTGAWEISGWTSALNLDSSPANLPSTPSPFLLADIPSDAEVAGLHLRTPTNNPGGTEPAWHAFVDDVGIEFANQTVIFNFEESSVPEPGSLLLLLSGLALAAWQRKRAQR